MRPGEFSIGVLSRIPIDTARARTFRTFLWKDLPGHHMPPGFYPAGAIERMPLSSKSHWDLPVTIGVRFVLECDYFTGRTIDVDGGLAM
jgi:hypothetical protein